MQDPNNLQVYQRALDYAEACATLCRRVDTRAAPGLRAQLMRSVTSGPANISEGVAQRSDRRCIVPLEVAISSLSETLTWLELAKRLSPRVGDVAPLVDEGLQIRKMSWALRDRYERRANASEH